MMGVGMAAAVFIDATVVRLLLVPAVMRYLGDAAWWLPKWLDRVLPHINIEGEPDAAVAAATVAATHIQVQGVAGIAESNRTEVDSAAAAR